MVKGINRANATYSERILFEHASHNKKCVFISHKSEDKRLFRGNGGLKTATTPVFISIKRHSTFG